MGNDLQQLLGGWMAAAGPLALLSFGLIPASIQNRQPLRIARIGSLISLIAFCWTIAVGLLRIQSGVLNVSFAVVGPFSLGVHLDNLSVIALILVAFLLAVVTRYSIQYLAGDPGQGRFTKWLCMTGGSVLVMVISGNLVQFALAWSATSLCLHKLLTFYPERSGAILAARKKFLISRMGDICLFAVILLTYQTFHTWDFSELLDKARRMHESGLGNDQTVICAICLLLVTSAMLKSAQFPFHSWLPDTMETPTPVSALMHAGIINAGGFLIIRLNPLMTLSPMALSTLALFGAFTALFASMVMLTHASVKRSLAFSTVAQMGFMMLECGLGAFGLALLHLVAHSLYKAHAFLSSGSIVSMARASWVPTARPGAHPLALAAAFATSLVLASGCAWLFGVDYQQERAVVVLGCTFAMALAYGLWNLWSQSPSLKMAVFGVMAGGGLTALYFALERLFVGLLGETAWTNAQLNSWPGLVLITVLLGLFLIVLVLQTELPSWANHRWLQALYVHARNGFYFNTFANRAVNALWPVKPTRGVP